MPPTAWPVATIACWIRASRCSVVSSIVGLLLSIVRWRMHEGGGGATAYAPGRAHVPSSCGPARAVVVGAHLAPRPRPRSAPPRAASSVVSRRVPSAHRWRRWPARRCRGRDRVGRRRGLRPGGLGRAVVLLARPGLLRGGAVAGQAVGQLVADGL